MHYNERQSTEGTSDLTDISKNYPIFLAVLFFSSTMSSLRHFVPSAVSAPQGHSTVLAWTSPVYPSYSSFVENIQRQIYYILNTHTRKQRCIYDV